MDKVKVAVVIGRFQPLLLGQIEYVLRPALESSDVTIVLLGSSMRARTCVDPFTAEDREQMIREAIFASSIDYETQESYVPIRDFLYSENDWIVQVQSAIKEALRVDHCLELEECEITIYGAEFEDEKDYLRQFPQWELYTHKLASNQKTNVFNNFFCDLESFLYSATYHLHQTTIDFMKAWINTEQGQRLKEEYYYISKYKEQTRTSKYPIQFQTVDNVAYYKGNVLLVKRRSQPGQGLWALPGGFLNPDETRFAGAIRELQEETKLKVKPEWLVAQRGFDAPNRSIRGRTITEAFLWKIPDTRSVPQIKAGSDAAKVQWFALSQIIEEMQEQLFEDHLDIIETLIKNL